MPLRDQAAQALRNATSAAALAVALRVAIGSREHQQAQLGGPCLAI